VENKIKIIAQLGGGITELDIDFGYNENRELCLYEKQKNVLIGYFVENQ
jgi:hypothetical protein